MVPGHLYFRHTKEREKREKDVLESRLERELEEGERGSDPSMFTASGEYFPRPQRKKPGRGEYTTEERKKIKILFTFFFLSSFRDSSSYPAFSPLIKLSAPPMMLTIAMCACMVIYEN